MTTNSAQLSTVINKLYLRFWPNELLNTLLLFTKQSRILLQSGITLADGLSILEHQEKNPYFAEVIKELRTHIQEGSSYADSLKYFPQIFSSFYLSLIQIGEKSGSLDKSLTYLESYLQNQISFRKRAGTSAVYPVLVLAVSTGMVGWVSFYIMPQLLTVFSSFNFQLPLSTRIMIGTAHFVRNYWWLIIATVAGAFVAWAIALRNPKIKFGYHWFLLHMPLFGQIYRNQQYAETFQNLGVMFRSGLPIGKIFEIQEESTLNVVLRRGMKQLSKALQQGVSLQKQLTNKNDFNFPPMVVSIISVGERTGRLDESFLYLGSYFDAEVDAATKSLLNLLEPLMLLVVGLVVAFIALSIIGPIYQFTGQIGVQ